MGSAAGAGLETGVDTGRPAAAAAAAGGETAAEMRLRTRWRAEWRTEGCFVLAAGGRRGRDVRVNVLRNDVTYRIYVCAAVLRLGKNS